MVECDLSTGVRICILPSGRWILVAAVLCDNSSFSGLVWTFKLLSSVKTKIRFSCAMAFTSTF
jgi:hypothetical protein